MTLRSRLPWWGRMAAKMLLARIPVSYRFWRSLGIFRHGDMHDPEHALAVFRAHLGRALRYRALASGFICLELGPGDSLLSGVVAAAMGASRVYMVDSGDYVVRDMEPYRRLTNVLRAQRLQVPHIEDCVDLAEVQRVCGIVHLTNGIEGLAQIPDDSVDYFWSQVVLEHIPRAEFSAMLRELRRITKASGMGSHSVDLGDHLGGALNNLRFSERAWESRFMSRSGFYTNRIRYSDMLKRFREAGFEVHVTDEVRRPRLHTPTGCMAEPYRSMDEDELRVAGFNVVLMPYELAMATGGVIASVNPSMQ